MKVYKTQEEVLKDVKDGVLAINDDVTFECDIDIGASINAENINAENINAENINARDINAENINAGNINARNINARDIDAWDINAWDINAWNINAEDIKARNINARNINARDIIYYAFCNVYNNIECEEIKSRRISHVKSVCLGGKLTIRKKVLEVSMDEVAEKFGVDVESLKIKKE